MFDRLSTRDLLRRHSDISVELRRREVCRTSNNPTGDAAEFLFSRTFNWPLETNSRAGFDAVCPVRGRVQIKARRVTSFNTSRQAGDIRDLEKHKFDWLAGVVFDADWGVLAGMLIPHHLICKRALKIEYSRSSRIYLRDEWFAVEGVENVTPQITRVWNQINAVAR